MRLKLLTKAAIVLTCTGILLLVSSAYVFANANPDQGNSSGTNTPSSNPSPGNKNAGCNQDPYGSSGNGANHSGPYDDTCNGSASQNGNGGGNATGKPCAGCVGKADEKNPQGQYPNGSDNNAGYECDRNSGIGKTNPAHTGCRTSTQSTPTPTPSHSPTPSPTPTPTPTSSVTQSPTPTPPAQVGGIQVTPPEASVLGETVTNAAPETSPALARTGSSIVAWLLWIGITCVMTGAILWSAVGVASRGGIS